MLPPADRTQEELAEHWSAWIPEQQAYYDYWLELAKPCEKIPPQAACFAANQVEQVLHKSHSNLTNQTSPV